MSVMYIAANNCLERGYYMGDVLTLIKTAWLFVRNEPHSHIILSLHDTDPLNQMWSRFIRENLVTVIYDKWEKENQIIQYQIFDERRTVRKVKGIWFDTYKELYPRLDGGDRQNILCGREAGIGRRNIFEYYYYGQETWNETIEGSTTFGIDVIDSSNVKRRTDQSVYIAPHEKCQGNRIFTHAFWQNVVEQLLACGISVTLNDSGKFCRHVETPLLSWRFDPLESIVDCIATERLVLCGNTGVGWIAGATGTPLIACEKSLHFLEYSFEKCGVDSLRKVIDEPNVEKTVEAVRAFLEG